MRRGMPGGAGGGGAATMVSPSHAAVDQAAALQVFAALSQPSRLAVFLHVSGAGPGGMPSQGLAEVLGTTGSALTLHLRALEAAGLIKVQVRRRGQHNPMVVARIDRCAELVARMANYCREAGWSLDLVPPDLVLLRPGAAFGAK